MKRSSYLSMVLDGVVGLIGEATELATDIKNFLSLPKTQQHLLASKPLPSRFVKKSEILCLRIESALACFSSGIGRQLEDRTVRDSLHQIFGAAKDAYAIIETWGLSGHVTKSKRANQLQLVVSQLDWVLQELASVKFDIVLYTKTPTSPTTKKAAAIPINTIVTPPTTPSTITPFLEQIRNRGWHVHCKPVNDPGQVEAIQDTFDQDAQLIQTIQTNGQKYLDDAVAVGMSSFPLISLNKHRLTDSVRQTLTDPAIGYRVYTVFGGYTVVENVSLVGIHRDVLRRVRQSGKIELDYDKYLQLLPYIKKEFPEWSSLVDNAYPVAPAKQAGQHYYCPLIPMSVLPTWGHLIGDWAPLR